MTGGQSGEAEDERLRLLAEARETAVEMARLTAKLESFTNRLEAEVRRQRGNDRG